MQRRTNCSENLSEQSSEMTQLGQFYLTFKGTFATHTWSHLLEIEAG